MLHLAGSDVETNRTGVVVLEVLQFGAADRAHLVRDGLARWAGEGANDNVLAWSDRATAELQGRATLVGVGGGLRSDLAQLCNGDIAVARESEGGGLKL